MYEQQHFTELRENCSYGDTKPWIAGASDGNSSPNHHSSTSGAAGNVDRVLFKDLVEIVPLVQSLIERKSSNSFTRRGSIVYTKTPSRESLSRKMIDPRGRNNAQSIHGKKKRDRGDKDQTKSDSNNPDAESIFSSRTSASECNLEEIVALREQVEDLQRKLMEKDEHLKSAEDSKSQMNAINAEFKELKLQVAEKDSLIKSTQLQLSDAKIKLADKQAALEKIHWEASQYNQKAERLQEELDSIQGDMSSFMSLFEGLTNNDPAKYSEDYDVKPYYLELPPDTYDLDEKEMQRMEEARQAYMAAIYVLRETQDEESIAAAADARRLLQSFVFGSNTQIA